MKSPITCDHELVEQWMRGMDIITQRTRIVDEQFDVLFVIASCQKPTPLSSDDPRSSVPEYGLYRFFYVGDQAVCDQAVSPTDLAEFFEALLEMVVR